MVYDFGTETRFPVKGRKPRDTSVARRFHKTDDGLDLVGLFTSRPAISAPKIAHTFEALPPAPLQMTQTFAMDLPQNFVPSYHPPRERYVPFQSLDRILRKSTSSMIETSEEIEIRVPKPK